MIHGIHRLEIQVPKQGNEYIEAKDFFGKTSDLKKFHLQLRVIGGHSFLSGFDAILFDGTMEFEIKFQNDSGRQIKPKVELYSSVAKRFSDLFPDKLIHTDLHSHTLSMNLLEDTQMSCDRSAEKILTKLAKGIKMPAKQLLKQSQWVLVQY